MCGWGGVCRWGGVSATKYVIIIIIIAPHALFRVRASVSRDRYLKGALATNRAVHITSHNSFQ